MLNLFIFKKRGVFSPALLKQPVKKSDFVGGKHPSDTSSVQPGDKLHRNDSSDKLFPAFD